MLSRILLGVFVSWTLLCALVMGFERAWGCGRGRGSSSCSSLVDGDLLTPGLVNQSVYLLIHGWLVRSRWDQMCMMEISEGRKSPGLVGLQKVW